MINSKQFQLFRKPSDDSDKSFHIDSHLLNNSYRSKDLFIQKRKSKSLVLVSQLEITHLTIVKICNCIAF